MGELWQTLSRETQAAVMQSGLSLAETKTLHYALLRAPNIAQKLNRPVITNTRPDHAEPWKEP
jgi:hypothetical protein